MSKVENGQQLVTGEKRKYSKEDYILLLVCVAFYLFFCICYGVEICADSAGYIEMISAREPVYPLFLSAFRWLFGVHYYLNMVILFQNLLMAYAVWKISLWFRYKFMLPLWLTSVVVVTHFAVVLLCQYAAARASVYTNSILTEGIALSLWLLFMYFLLEALFEYNLKYVLYALLLAAVMFDTRKQMAVAYIVLFGTLFLGWLGKKGYLKKILITLAMIIGSLFLALLGTRIYNYALRGEFAQNTRDMNLVLTTTLYVADKEDVRLIPEESVRQLYTEVMDVLYKNGSNIDFAGSGWKNLESHYSEHFDKITIDTTAPMFLEYAIAHGFSEGIEAEQEADRACKVIVKALFWDNIGKYAKVYGASMANGFINTIAKRNAVLDYCAVAAYAGYLFLMTANLLSKERRCYGLAGMTVLIAVAVNVMVAAALIFCQTRYMIYNMALFYSAFIVMLYPYMRKFTQRRTESSHTS